MRYWTGGHVFLSRRCPSFIVRSGARYQQLVNLCDHYRMTDDDWAQMSMLLRAYQAGGEEALKKAMNELKEKDQSCFSRVAKAIEA